MTETAIDDLTGWLTVYRKAAEEKSGDSEVGTIDDKPVVRWTFVHAERFDQKKAKEILGDDAAACMVPTVSRRFTLVTGDDA